MHCRAGLSCPCVKDTQRGCLNRRVSLCGRNRITLTALQAARIGACTCIPEPTNPCVSVCAHVRVFVGTPAIFQLSFIFLSCELLFLSRRVLTCRGRLKEMAGMFFYEIKRCVLCVLGKPSQQRDTPSGAIFRSAHLEPQQFFSSVFFFLQQ